MELIRGEVIEMTSMGVRHAAAVTRLTALLLPVLKGQAILRPQLPLRLDDFNEPEPDIALLKPSSDFYSTRHPGPADVFLVIEVADSSLRYDRDVKLPVYAIARVAEVWILDLQSRVLLVFRDPAADGYSTTVTIESGGAVSPIAFPEMSLALNDIIG